MTLELSKLSNAALHSKLLDLATESRCNEAFMLRFLSEVEVRQLHLDKGYPSLFEYCRSELKVSESAAWRLIASARAARQQPQIYDLLAAGTIHSTAVAMIASSLKDEGTAADRLALACGKTKRELEVLIAGWSAKPVAKVKDSIRALANDGAAPGGAQAGALNFERPGDMVSSCAEAGACAAQATAAAAEKRRMVIRFEATGELVELIDRAKEVLAHVEAGRSLAALFGEALEALLDKRDPVRVASRREARKTKKSGRESKGGNSEPKPAASAPAATTQAQEAPTAQMQTQRPVAAQAAAATPPPVKPAATFNRHIPPEIRAAVTTRSGGQCEFVSDVGLRCSARSCLHVDHVEPFALGGSSELGNLRHLCAAHNRRRAAQTFGAWGSRAAATAASAGRSSACRA